MKINDIAFIMYVISFVACCMFCSILAGMGFMIVILYATGQWTGYIHPILNILICVLFIASIPFIVCTIKMKIDKRNRKRI